MDSLLGEKETVLPAPVVEEGSTMDMDGFLGEKETLSLQPFDGECSMVDHIFPSSFGSLARKQKKENNLKERKKPRKLLQLPPHPPEHSTLLLQFPPHRPELVRYAMDLNFFLTRKEKLLANHGLPSTIKEYLEFEIPTSLGVEETENLLNDILCAARVFFLDEVELYFIDVEEDANHVPFDTSTHIGPSNELESLSMILSKLRSLICPDLGTDAKEVIHRMEDHVLNKIDKLVQKYEAMYSNKEPCRVDSAFELLEKWGRSLNIKKKLMIAKGGRGLIASEDIDIGDIVLEIPSSLLLCISSETEPPKSHESANRAYFTRFVDYILQEKSNPDSDYAIFLDSVPRKFKTGLSFSDDALKVARGTMLLRQIDRTKAVMEEHFYLRHRGRGQVTRKSHKWANELLLSHGIKALLSNGRQKLCLAPFAGFFKHSPFPHVLQGELDGDSLRFIASRPCSKGQQCYLTHMNLSGAELATNYGYLPKGKNPNDIIRLDPTLGLECYEIITEGYLQWTSLMVRIPWETKGRHCLPKALINHFESVFQAYAESCGYEREEWTAKVMLRNFFLTRSSMCSRRMQMPEEEDQNLKWDVKLALACRRMEHRICRFVLELLDQD